MFEPVSMLHQRGCKEHEFTFSLEMLECGSVVFVCEKSESHRSHCTGGCAL